MLPDLNEAKEVHAQLDALLDLLSDKKVKTYILSKNGDLAGYFELILHPNEKEVEIAYLGLLEEYQNQKLGSYLLSSAIKKSFLDTIGLCFPSIISPGNILQTRIPR